MTFTADDVEVKRHGSTMYTRGCRCRVCKRGHAHRIAAQRARRKNRVGVYVAPSVAASESRHATAAAKNATFDGNTASELIEWCEANPGRGVVFTSDTGNGSDVDMLESMFNESDTELEWVVADDGLSIHFGIPE